VPFCSDCEFPLLIAAEVKLDIPQVTPLFVSPFLLYSVTQCICITTASQAFSASYLHEIFHFIKLIAWTENMYFHGPSMVYRDRDPLHNFYRVLLKHSQWSLTEDG
jgi:hypothetical protein